MKDTIDLNKLTDAQKKEREDFFKKHPDNPPRQFYVTCSGTIAPFPTKKEDWESARSNGEFLEDGAEIFPDDD